MYSIKLQREVAILAKTLQPLLLVLKVSFFGEACTINKRSYFDEGLRLPLLSNANNRLDAFAVAHLGFTRNGGRDIASLIAV